MSYSAIESDVVRWGEARKIIQNSTPIAQHKKLVEEVEELRVALEELKTNPLAINDAKDAIGDCLVVLVMIAAILDVDVVKDCFEAAYNQIKHRKGYLNEDGIFVKEA